MPAHEILRHIDYTLLKPTATQSQIDALCREAVRLQTASACIPPRFVRHAKHSFGDQLTVCTVVGFPLGYQTTAIKVAETREAIADGADEIDMVIAVGQAKQGHFQAVLEEISALRQVSQGKILKVIIETCYLTDAEKIGLCRVVTQSGADYIKTSTGFGPSGAVMDDIALFKAHIGSSVKIKAAGGIRTQADMLAFWQAGCDRIGASADLASLFDV